jgi:hypothetical protein
MIPKNILLSSLSYSQIWLNPLVDQQQTTNLSQNWEKNKTPDFHQYFEMGFGLRGFRGLGI